MFPYSGIGGGVNLSSILVCVLAMLASIVWMKSRLATGVNLTSILVCVAATLASIVWMKSRLATGVNLTSILVCVAAILVSISEHNLVTSTVGSGNGSGFGAKCWASMVLNGSK